ncbi:MAG: metal-dependent hydrolase [Verrucomicrobiales bacterium]|nr:metal-dependent hydrolase [Verrucomicrobiales bacterium]
MSPLTHFAASWVLGAMIMRSKRDCTLVALAGIAPDLDGLTLVPDIVTSFGSNPHPTQYYARYHHFLFHGIIGALTTAICFTFFARDKFRTFMVCFVVFHFHLFCDFVGSRGPAPEDLWPIYYLGPLDRDPMLIWKNQWPLDAWPNRIFGFIAMGIALIVSVKKGFSPLSVFNDRLDRHFCGNLASIVAQIKARRSRRGL